MIELINSVIDNIFSPCSQNNEAEENNVAFLFSHYEKVNEEVKKNIINKMIDRLSIIRVYDLKKWCLILVKMLSNYSASFEYLIDLFVLKSKENRLPTVVMGMKLGAIVVLHVIVKFQFKNLTNDIVKLLYFVANLVNEKVVGVIASSVLSRCIKQLSCDQFNPTMTKIFQLTLIKNNVLSKCPNLYFVLLSLKEEHKKILLRETVDLLNFQSESEVKNFINTFLTISDTEISSLFFNEFAVSNLFEIFWNLLTGCLDKEKFIYCEREVFLKCLFQTINPVPTGLIDQATAHQKLAIIDIVWKKSRIWKFFFSNLSDDKSLFQNLCKNLIVQLKSTSMHFSAVVEKLFEYFISVADKQCHFMESNVPQSFRLSQALIGLIKDSNQLTKYVDLLMKYFEENCSSDEKVFIIEQLEYSCHCTTDIHIHNTCIDKIIAIQTQELAGHLYLSDKLNRSSFSALISCIHHSVTVRNISMSEYLIYLKSVIAIVVHNLSNNSSELKTPLQIIKSLSKYIDEQLEIGYENPVIVDKVFPCFGSVICYLSLFLLSKTDLRNCEKSLNFCNQIIDWIKQCFQAANKSIGCNSLDKEIPSRKRMLSISSLCSDDENEMEKTPENYHWSFYLLDILLKIYDEDAMLMNKAVNSIVSLMIRTKTLEISAVRYLKNLILSENARRRKIIEFDLVIKLNNADSPGKDSVQYDVKLINMKGRCLNILSTIILESNDMDMIASCLFILLDICSTGDQILISQIENLVSLFKDRSKFYKDFYINGQNTIRAIDSILTLSNDTSNYENFVELASNIITGLINRTDLNEETIMYLKSMMDKNLFGSISNFQKLILQKFFMEHVEITWHLREALFECIVQPDIIRLTKYKAFCIIKNIINSGRPDRGSLVLHNYSEFVTRLFPIVAKTLCAFNFESLNVKYATIILECFFGIILTNTESYKIPDDLLENFKKKFNNMNPEIRNLIKNILEIYKHKNFNLQMISLEKLQEYDDYVSYLMRLLPSEYYKDLDVNSNISSVKAKPVKESKAMSKFQLIAQKKRHSDKLNESKILDNNSNSRKRKINDSETHVRDCTPDLKKTNSNDVNDSISVKNKGKDLKEASNTSELSKIKNKKHKNKNILVKPSVTLSAPLTINVDKTQAVEGDKNSLKTSVNLGKQLEGLNKTEIKLKKHKKNKKSSVNNDKLKTDKQLIGNNEFLTNENLNTTVKHKKKKSKKSKKNVELADINTNIVLDKLKKCETESVAVSSENIKSSKKKTKKSKNCTNVPMEVDH